MRPRGQAESEQSGGAPCSRILGIDDRGGDAARGAARRHPRLHHRRNRRCSSECHRNGRNIGRLDGARTVSGGRRSVPVPRRCSTCRARSNCSKRSASRCSAIGRTSFPAFYSRESGLPVDRRFDDIGPLAHAVRAHLAFNTEQALVVNPVRPGARTATRRVASRQSERALADATRGGHSRARRDAVSSRTAPQVDRGCERLLESGSPRQQRAAGRAKPKLSLAHKIRIPRRPSPAGGVIKTEISTLRLSCTLTPTHTHRHTLPADSTPSPHHAHTHAHTPTRHRLLERPKTTRPGCC